MAKIRLTRKKFIVFIIVLVGLAVFLYEYGITFNNFFYVLWTEFRAFSTSKNPTVYVYNYHGYDIFFRANLTEALSVPVYPDDKGLFNAVTNQSVKRIHVVFVNSTDNSLVAVNGFEVSNKLSIIFYINGISKKIKGIPVDDYNLTGTEDTLVIALIPPALANTTEVRLEDNVIFISGKSSKEFDLATVRFLMSIMEVVV